eukprot:6180043-Pleurochrysis_carterae.AAC.2
MEMVACSQNEAVERAAAVGRTVTAMAATPAEPRWLRYSRLSHLTRADSCVRGPTLLTSGPSSIIWAFHGARMAHPESHLLPIYMRFMYGIPISARDLRDVPACVLAGFWQAM